MIVQFRSSFLKDLRNIKNKHILARIKASIHLMEKANNLGDIPHLKKLKGGHRYFSIRLGEYRIGITHEGTTVTYVRCLNRKEIYRFFP